MHRVAAIAVAIALSTSSPPTRADDATASPLPDPGAIFGSVRATLAAQRYPAYLSYSVAVRLQSNRSVREGHYDGVLQTATGGFRVHQFSHEEDDHPSTPHGVNVVLKIKGRDPTMLTKHVADQPIGVPDLSPIYTFGLRGCPVSPAGAGDASSDTLKAIGSVIAISRVYRSAFAGSVDVDGIHAMHLALVPVANPERNRLRDLWLDDAGMPVQARVARNFTSKALESASWLIHFTTAGGITYIASETAEQPIRIGRETYGDVTITFSKIAADRSTASLLSFALPQFGDPDNGFMEPIATGAC